MKVTLDAREVTENYTRAFRELRRLTGFDHRAVLRAEAGVLLKTWAARTRPTTWPVAERRGRSGVAWKLGMQNMSGSPYGITVNDGSRKGVTGVVWFRTRNGKFQVVGEITDNGGFVPRQASIDGRSFLVRNRSTDWSQIENGARVYAALLANRLPKVKASLGLSRQSIVQAAMDLGIDLGTVKGGGSLGASAIEKAKGAVASNGSQYKNGTGAQVGDDVRTSLTITNTLPHNVKIGMGSSLLIIISGRAKFIEQSYKRGAFDSIRNTAKQFPNLYLRDMASPPAEN